ncbi:type II toxin-antitoxin system RelE/ParE family toxin [Sinosporangium album]|uniref:type II toxin-antitoxin system RelE/ParE family toxin n=1 Tax=Sinosporangium album TaxID=504805 RepID=UPI001FE1244F|nr:type II toxin-antitoxin system RelE/ParE family toxin [Sinosporangium album]
MPSGGPRFASSPGKLLISTTVDYTEHVIAALCLLLLLGGAGVGLYRFELEPEVREWLSSLGDSDFKRVDEVAGLLALKGVELGGPWSDHLEGPVWELRVRLRDVAARITYWVLQTRPLCCSRSFARPDSMISGRSIGRFARRRYASAITGGPRPRVSRGRCDGWLPHPPGAPGGGR